MQLAVELGKKSARESKFKPYVGVVIVRDNELLGESYRGKTGTGEHAEYGLIKTLEHDGIDLSGATVYSTLEPCSTRNHPKLPCAVHLIESGVSKVFTGIYDPNPHIYRAGWKMLNRAGIEQRDFPEGLRSEICADNKEFREQYLKADGPNGTANFDWTQRDGVFTVMDDATDLPFRVGTCGADSVYIYRGTNDTCLMRGATDFKDVDDPGASSWGRHGTGLRVGEIVAVRYDSAYLLIKAKSVSNMNSGAPFWEFSFDYEIRPR